MWVRGLKLFLVTQTRLNGKVAPHVGAWIETYLTEYVQGLSTSHPMWVRGLKHGIKHRFSVKRLSHPMWVRGLKPKYYRYLPFCKRSHPMWVRGLKLI